VAGRRGRWKPLRAMGIHAPPVDGHAKAGDPRSAPPTGPLSHHSLL
jgi:hypothetical protein